MIHGYEISRDQNIAWLQQDASRLVGKPSPHIVLVQRLGESRMFHEDAVEQLRASLQSTNLPVPTYFGSESVVDTIRLFNQAAGVVGYHGAAWANVMFSAYPHCLHQISTWENLGGTKQWRVNTEVSLNPQGQLHVYNIPLDLLL